MKNIELVFHKYSTRYRKETVEVERVVLDLESLPITQAMQEKGYVLWGVWKI